MMMEATAGRAPSMGTVMAEQLRVVGLAVRREAILAALILGGATLATAVMVRFGLFVVDSQPYHAMVLAPEQAMRIEATLVALLFPLAVWKGERFFGESQLWLLPVTHRRHALIKVAAGWTWLMALYVIALSWMVALTLVTGGSVGPEETRWIITDALGPATAVQWSTQWWEWLVPFGGATAAYLVGSALLLGTRHPVWSAAGVWASLLGVMVIMERTQWQGAADGLQRLFWCVGLLEPRVTATIPGVGRVSQWLWLPSLGLWVGTVAIWLALGGAVVVAATSRHRGE
jgi:hypothetical protein